MAYYSSSYYKERIKEIEDNLLKYQTMPPNTTIKNGPDEFQAGDMVKQLMTLLNFYERKLNEALVAEGSKSSRKRIIRYDMGEGE
jgi:conjugal transfer/entry exclusion protein